MRPAVARGHSGAFVLGGAVMIAGLANAAVTTFEVVWPWMMAGGVAIAVGLFRLASRLEGEAARVRRLGRVLACIAGAGAFVYVAVTVSFVTVDAVGGELPTPMEGLFGIGGLGFLAGVIGASVLIGGAALRRGPGMRGAGFLLLASGLLFLSPFPVLFGLDIPESMPFIAVALLATVQLLIGYTLRPTAAGPSTASPQPDARSERGGLDLEGVVNSAYALDSLAAVREIIGEPSRMVPLKLMDSLDDMAIDFIGRSPFLMLATTSEDGLPEVSPKGDQPGFVAVEDANTLVIPERKGNRLIFSLQNILANGGVAAIFLVPGTEETLRVQGRAELTADPQLCERFTARGRPALLVMRVRVERCYFHCAKAFKRSGLWDPESWPPPQRVSFGKQAKDRHGLDAEVAKQIDDAVEEDYRTNL